MNLTIINRKDSGFFPGPFQGRGRRLSTQELIDAKIGAALVLAASLSPTPIIEATAVLVRETPLPALPAPTEKPFTMDSGPTAEVIPLETAPVVEELETPLQKRGKKAAACLPRRHYRKGYHYTCKTTGRRITVEGKWKCPKYRGYAHPGDENRDEA